MKCADIMKMWWTGLTNTDNALKKLNKEKLSFKDGALSIIILAFIASALLAVLIGALMIAMPGSESLGGIAATFFIPFAFISIFCVLGLALFTWVFRKIADKSKGKGKFERTAGFFGLLLGMLVIAMVPYIIGYVLMILLASIPLLAFLIFGAGALVYMAYVGKIGGMAFEFLSGSEKLAVNKIGWVQGLSLGIIYFAGLALMGIISQLIGVMFPMF